MNNRLRKQEPFHSERSNKLTRLFRALGPAALLLALSLIPSAGQSEHGDPVKPAGPLLEKFRREIRPLYNSMRIIRPQFQPILPSKIAITVKAPPPFAPSLFRAGEETAIPEEAVLPGAPKGKETVSGIPYNGGISPPAAVRVPDTRTSLREDMVTLADFANGPARAMAARDPARPEKIRGFVSIPAVWGVQLAPPVPIRRAPMMLAEAVIRYTGLEARVDPHLTLDSRRLSSTPFLYITADEAFELTPTERKRFGEYLRSGGFAFLDTGSPQYENSPAEASLRRMLRDALGAHARFEPIPSSHPIYHSVFTFTDGPPQGDENGYMFTKTTGECGCRAYSTLLKSVYCLEGVFLDGRLVAVYSGKGYGFRWVQGSDNQPQLKFGVNIVVYALTREGSITARVMERFADVQ